MHSDSGPRSHMFKGPGSGLKHGFRLRGVPLISSRINVASRMYLQGTQIHEKGSFFQTCMFEAVVGFLAATDPGTYSPKL